MLAFLFSVSETLEDWAVTKARRELHAVLSARHRVVSRDGTTVEVPTGELRTGDVVVLRSGARLVTAAVLAEGASTLDLSAATGESIPVERGPGDTMPAGGHNGGGHLELIASAPASDSTLARILHPVEAAQDRKGHAQCATSARRGAALVSALREQGMSVHLLTGDHHATAAAIGQRDGIDDSAPSCCGDEAEAVAELARLRPVATIGGGISDAPALATADVDIAMGAAGSDAAIEAADVRSWVITSPTFPRSSTTPGGPGGSSPRTSRCRPHGRSTSAWSS